MVLVVFNIISTAQAKTDFTNLDPNNRIGIVPKASAIKECPFKKTPPIQRRYVTSSHKRKKVIRHPVSKITTNTNKVK
jgi:hypothetical protein